MHLKLLFGCLIALFCLFTAHVNAATFFLKPEWNGACEQTDTIDVNLGHASDVFVRAAYCQINGKEPSQELINTTADDLKTNPRARRIDVVRQLCADADRECPLTFSNPWVNNPLNTAPVCIKKSTRDIGAIIMMFFHCPRKTNCQMDWANTHTIGMDTPDAQFGWGNKTADYYNADNPGFWKYELKNAQAAGLQFIAPNVFGPDMVNEGTIDALTEALEKEKPAIKIGLFDDTNTWGKPYSTGIWKQLPSFDNPEQTAALLYRTTWSSFFNKIPENYWYRIQGKPVIYFYNGGTLKPLNKAAAIIKKMKEMFLDDFGVAPFVIVDSAFFADPAMPDIADSEFIFNTIQPKSFRTPTVMLSNSFSLSKMNGINIASAMVKWDAVGRDNPNKIPDDTDLIIKGPERLKKVLSNSRNAKSLLLETWNDLGEGTNLNRNYDYYYQGKWLQPDHFINIIRRENCKN